jgi:signal transduction histidine kinase
MDGPSDAPDLADPVPHARAGRWVARLHDPRQLPGVVISLQIATDLFFNTVVAPAYLDLLAVQGAERREVLHQLVAVTAAVLVALAAVLAALTLPIARALRGGLARCSHAALQSAGAALHRLPYRVALVMSAQQALIQGIPIALRDHTPSTGSDVCFILAMGCGPLPVCYSVTALAIAPVVRQVAAAARARRVELPAPRLRLRRLLALYTLFMCCGPLLYVGSIAFSTQAQQLSSSAVTRLLLVSLLAVGPHALICATMLAATISRPLGMMTDILRTITRQGDVSRVGRVPYAQRDEVGELAESTNQMIDRLEQTATERKEFAASLSSLNHTLEQRVAERTESLSRANTDLAREMEARLHMELELRRAQKLEAIGRLANGIAHEINTPVQFTSDSVTFVAEASRDLFALLGAYRALHAAVVAGTGQREAIEEVSRRTDAVDLAYLSEQVPAALDRALDGLDRVSTIVRSMKEFSHPDGSDMTHADLNQAITTTLAVARHEYKDVAEVVTDFGELPPVQCYLGAINQVVLNLVVNASHAIADAVAPRPGRITVRTRCDGGCVTISVTDTGAGIPEAIRDRIFDPFFTTKEVGRGTGQGLAIARSVVAKHGGELSFETEVDAGTTFTVRLPLTPPTSASQ